MPAITGAARGVIVTSHGMAVAAFVTNIVTLSHAEGNAANRPEDKEDSEAP